MLKQLTGWTTSWASTSLGPGMLFVLSFAESSFFPIPPDFLLIALCMMKPELSFYLATICTVGSVLGGMFGYFIGLKGGLPILRKFFSEDKIEAVHKYFEKYEHWAIGVAAFTPIPYKVFTISAGVFYINFKIFVLMSILGRGGRFFLVAGVFYFFGEEIKKYLFKYFDIFTIFFIGALVLGFYALKFFRVKKKGGKV